MFTTATITSTNNNNNLFLHLLVCHTTGPNLLTKRTFLIVRSRAFTFRCEYPLLSLRSSSSFLRLLPHLPVTSIPSFIFPSVTCRRRQFLRKMRPIQLAFHLLISCRIFLCFLTKWYFVHLHFSHHRSNWYYLSFSKTIIIVIIIIVIIITTTITTTIRM
jgi:magnesium-transporting ATPase (P-type)